MNTHITTDSVYTLFPKPLWSYLQGIHKDCGGEVYLTGGTVRDLLLGRKPLDLDLTVTQNLEQWGELLAAYSGGAHVPMGREELTVRIVWNKVVIDFSGLRLGASNMREELQLRDFTMNALAIRIDPLLASSGDAESSEKLENVEEAGVAIIDPTGGLHDLAKGSVRMVANRAFTDDPLRMVRAYRFAATYGFDLDEGTAAAIRIHHALLCRVSVERIASEFQQIFASPRACQSITAMVDSELLWQVLPELRDGVGMEQPGSHHLDVFGHSLEALRQMELLLADPKYFFADAPLALQAVEDYLHDEEKPALLKWAALLHDLGKPPTFGKKIVPDGEKITFYTHDKVGVELFFLIAERLRWRKKDSTAVAALIGHHMRPFHLLNSAGQGKKKSKSGISPKACLRLIKAVGAELPGLFLLALADTSAGKGEKAPLGMKADIARLYGQIEAVRLERIVPVQQTAPLITGRELINVLQLTPGPLFSFLLAAVEEAQVEGRIASQEEALALVRDLIEAGSLPDAEVPA